MGNNQTANQCFPCNGRLVCAYRRHRNDQRIKGHRGLTLVELLVVVAIITVLSSITLVAVSKARTYAETANAVSGARALISAFLSYGADNGGKCFIGYDSTPHVANDIMEQQAMTRYPFRLAPYYGENYQGTIWLNGNKEQIDSTSKGEGPRRYAYSTYPAFGMNYFFVGGELITKVDGRGSNRVTSYEYSPITEHNAITHHHDAESRLIVFASSGSDGIDGYHVVTPPNFYANRGDHVSWNSPSGWRPNSKPENYGHVNARYDGKAIVARMGGSVDLMTIKELADMRLWSRDAITTNNSNFQPTFVPEGS